MSVASTPLSNKCQNVNSSIPKQEEQAVILEETIVLQSMSKRREKASYRPTSPSPRRIEIWGPCSPFLLPSPPSHINYINPEEFAIAGDCTLSEKRLDIRSQKDVKIEQGSQGEFMEIDDFFGRGQVPCQTSVSGSGSTLQKDAKMINIPLLERDADDKFIEGLFSQFHPSSYLESTLNTGQTILKNTEQPTKSELGFNQSDDTVHKSEDGRGDNCKPGKNGTQQVRAFFANNGHAVDELRLISDKGSANKDKSTDTFICSENNTETSFVISENNSGTAIEKNKAPTAGYSEQLTEEELKKIRRVKNRASVEKCRTKQRLRMEALQKELKTLTSENKTLRDLISCMDASVVVISTQLSEPEVTRESLMSPIQAMSSVKADAEKINEV